jgi:hypothetical protein
MSMSASRIKMGSFSLLAMGLSAVILTAGCASGGGAYGRPGANGATAKGHSSSHRSVVDAADSSNASLGTACTGTQCDGLDPTMSYELDSNPPAICSAGAYDTTDLPNGGTVLGGFFELRFGPNCQTNWVRWIPPTNDEYQISIWQEDFAGDYGNALIVDDFSGKAGQQQYTNQRYAPFPVVVVIKDLTTGQSDLYKQPPPPAG